MPGLMLLIRSIGLFVVAGLLEIGGGYLVWKWLRTGQALWLGLAGMALLGLYGVVATFQPAHFGRVYAAYGGVFIAMAMLWGWGIDGIRPDRYDVVGAAFALVGVAIMMYAPRQAVA